MIAKLTVIFFIALLLQLGFILIVAPWVNLGPFGSWDDNFLLAFLSDETGIPAIKTIVTSGWVRGAVSGLGVINIIVGFWEIFHFSKAVEMIEGKKGE